MRTFLEQTILLLRLTGLLLSACLVLPAVAEFKVPPLRGPVMDEVGVLPGRIRQELTSLLKEFQRRDVGQVQILILDSLEGLPIESAAIQIVDEWRLGSEETDNGVLFLIAVQDRRMRIEVGQGLEGFIPDVVAKRIIEDEVVPYFRAGRLADGIVHGTLRILNLIDADFVAKQPAQKRAKSPAADWVVILMILLFIIIGPMGRMSRRRALWGGMGGFGGGALGGGGFSGGGWSGGGGGFSGGGASGSW